MIELLFPLRKQCLVLLNITLPLGFDFSDSLLILDAHLLLSIMSLLPEALYNSRDLSVALFDSIFTQFLLEVSHLLLLLEKKVGFPRVLLDLQTIFLSLKLYMMAASSFFKFLLKLRSLFVKLLLMALSLSAELVFKLFFVTPADVF